MKLLSRRNLLASVSSLFLSTSIESNPLFHDAVSVRRSGQINLGLNGLTHYMAFYSFLNAWKSGAPIQVINNGVSYWSNIPAGSPNSAWGRFLDDDGELVRPLPAGTSQVERIFYSSERDGLPDGYNRIGEVWVLKWEGMASTVSVVSRSPRFVWATGSNGCGVSTKVSSKSSSAASI